MIILIVKKVKIYCKEKNYRPISLLNVDYKILSKVLASRITKVLNEVILEDQLGFMKGRNIGEAIRIIDDMIFHNKNTGYLYSAVHRSITALIIYKQKEKRKYKQNINIKRTLLSKKKGF